MSKKLTYRRFLDIAEYPVGDAWKILQPYLADEQPAEPQVLTLDKFTEIAHVTPVTVNDMYEALRPYLIGVSQSQPAEHPTKSEPSRLEVAQDKRERFWMDVWIAVASSSNVTGKDIPTLWANTALEGYDELIKQRL